MVFIIISTLYVEFNVVCWLFTHMRAHTSVRRRPVHNKLRNVSKLSLKQDCPCQNCVSKQYTVDNNTNNIIGGLDCLLLADTHVKCCLCNRYVCIICTNSQNLRNYNCQSSRNYITFGKSSSIYCLSFSAFFILCVSLSPIYLSSSFLFHSKLELFLFLLSSYLADSIFSIRSHIKLQPLINLYISVI